MRRARDFVQASDAKLAISGKIDKVLYIFRGKNFYSMTDSVKIDLKNGIVIRQEQSGLEYSTESVETERVIPP